MRALRSVCAVLLAVLFAQTLLAQETERRPVTTDDGLEMVGLGGVAMHPSGDWVLFSKSELDWDENKRETTWWRADADGGEPYRYIGEEGGSGFQFSEDGRWLSFTRSVESKAQIFLMRTDGGEATQLTKHDAAVGTHRWLDDGSAIVFVAPEARTKEEEAARKKGEDVIFVDEGPSGQREGQWTNLWLIPIDSDDGKAERLTEVEHRVSSFAPSPDGLRIAFVGRRENRRNQGNLAEIYLLDRESGEVAQLTENEAPESRVAWLPDGSRIVFSAAGREGWDLRLNKLWTIDPETREESLLLDFAGNLGASAFTPDGRVMYFSGQHGTNRNLYRLDVGSGEMVQVTDVVGSLSPSSFSRDGSRMAYIRQSLDTPPDLYVSPTSGLTETRLTDLNPDVGSDLLLAEGRTIRWASSDGTEIEGILILPPAHDGAALPLLVHIHGGPAGVFSNTFRSSYHVWAGLGYAQLLPNVRGSSGYSDGLLRGNMNDIGGGDYEDVMTGVEYLVAEGIADPDRLAVRGWSYGGILGGWTITQTDRFKAASLGAMVSDWTSEYGPGFNYDVRRWYIGGTPWENADRFRQMSALTHIASVTTPTLLLHGMNDRTDTEPQSMMFFQALRDQGKVARYLRFPREPHGFREPRHQRIRDVEEIRWIQKYTLGLEWEPWERPTKEDEQEDGSEPPVIS
jgi:dipeptidyl aminopeptidase/acylaminoacyl peptidase